MEFVVIGYQDGVLRERLVSSGFTFETVKQDAIKRVEEGFFDSLEIFDATDQLLFHHPRITSPA